MTPPKKPDWMEIADNDGGSNNPAPKAKKSRPVLIAATALVLTFGGAIIAQSSQDSPTSVEQSIVPQASQSATSVSPAISPATPSATNPPAIATPPSMKGGDDDNDDFEEDGHRDRRDREHGDRDEDGDDHDEDDDEFEDH
jgi:hypothetical protein